MGTCVGADNGACAECATAAAARDATATGLCLVVDTRDLHDERSHGYVLYFNSEYLNN